ncbi:MAG TPA: class II aldolase/adducin family protein [Candidatus Eisenbacteria bacterium]|nr:class II aldolase/adducin family protein [Candidatus Eisenbacteria bacterium]
MSTWKLRNDLVVAARELPARGLTAGTSGNVSVRDGAGMWITPSGVAYGAMTASDIVHVDGSGRVVEGHLTPSSEWRLHLGVYAARAEVGAIVHAHPRHATALACTERPIPAFHYMVAIAGGDSIRCAPYAPFGTEELAQVAALALADRRACLLANHGAVAVGKALPAALDLMTELEELAAQYVSALAIGNVAILSREDMAEALERFRDYGQR